MARFVLAGRSDCPHYAKAEHLADLLHRALPHFSIHYICIHPPAWQEWLENTCRANGWSHQQSPLVWRELIHRGGKALYLGGFTDFMEHCQEYYSITSHMSTEVMLKIAEENLESKVKLMEEEERRLSLIQPHHIWIAGALNPTCQSLLPHLLSCELFPQLQVSTSIRPHLLSCELFPQPQVSTSIRPHLPSSEEFPQVSTSISLHLLDLEAEVEVLHGLRMEIQDLALPLLHQVSVHVDLERAFQDADLIILLDDRWPEEGDAQSEEEEDDEARKKKKDLRRISARYEAYGRLMDQRAHREVKVLVAGDTLVNLKCSLLLDHAPSIHSWCFVAVATQLEYEARALVARKLGVRPSDVTDVMVWGNIGGSSYVDLQRAKVFNYDGAIKGPAFFSRAVLEVLHDRKWLNTDLPALVHRQRATVTSRGQRTGSMSATNAILHVLKAWSQTSSKPEQLLSLGVLCPGHYELPEGVVLSLPVTFKEGRWSELFDRTMMGHDLRGALQRCAEELKQERITCFQACYEDSLKTTVPSDPQPSLLT